MRSDLEKVPGISEIKTDIKAKTCTFQLSDENLDVTAKLNELAGSNEHLKNWSLVETVN